MGLLDGLEAQAEALGAKVGLPAEQVRAIIATLKEKLGMGKDQQTAVSETSQETGVSTDKISELLGQLGGGDLMGKLGGMAKGLFG